MTRTHTVNAKTKEWVDAVKALITTPPVEGRQRKKLYEIDEFELIQNADKRRTF